MFGANFIVFAWCDFIFRRFLYLKKCLTNSETFETFSNVHIFLLFLWKIFHFNLTIFFHIFQALEDEFAFQLEEQERHYGPYLNSALSAEAAAAEGWNSATPTQRRGSQPSRKASSKSSGSERSTESSSRKSSMNVDSPTKYGGGAGHRHSVATPTSHVNHHHHHMSGGQRRLSASRHSLASRGSDL